MNQKQRIALVSGSTHGIGLAISKKLREDGYLVIQNSRNQIYQSEIQGKDYFVADVSVATECYELIQKVKDKYGQLDVLVCNVGSGQTLDPDIGIEDYWKYYLRANFYSASFLVEAALDLLLLSKGKVVAISSICADDLRINAPFGYSVTKTALETFMKSMAIKHGQFGLRFNVVSPGNVYFDGSVWDRKMKDGKEAVEAYINDVVPLRSFVFPEDIAESVSFLISDKAKNITGVVLKVDGGQSL